MASEWDWGMGMGFGFGMGMGASVAPPFSTAAAAPPNHANSSAYLYGLPSADTLRIDDLLDLSSHDVFSSSAAAAAAESHVNVNSQPESCSVAGNRPFAGEYSNSSASTYHSHSRSFADDIYIPSDEAAELEWLSKFVEDSDVPYPSNYLPANPQARVDPATAVPGRGARSKRSRVPSANLARTLAVPNQSSSSSSTSSSSSSDFPQPAHIGSNGGRRKSAAGVEFGINGVEGGGGRRCTHCASENTPQWRTGPLGPKTLCNACGVRYKSGRLVPEYRPAASPTFVLTQHSNSHRKVMELRRQKEQLQFIRHDNNSTNNAAASPVAVKAELIYHI